MLLVVDVVVVVVVEVVVVVVALDVMQSDISYCLACKLMFFLIET